jgi:hypothetical protein
MDLTLLCAHAFEERDARQTRSPHRLGGQRRIRRRRRGCWTELMAAAEENYRPSRLAHAQGARSACVAAAALDHHQAVACQPGFRRDLAQAQPHCIGVHRRWIKRR